MTYEPSSEAEEAAMSGHPESWRETIHNALTAALPIEHKRWGEEVRERALSGDAAFAIRRAVLSSPVAASKGEVAFTAVEAALNTIFGPEEGEQPND